VKSVFYLIGGGEISKKETIHIDKNAFSEVKSERPEVLFVGAASNDSEEYFKTFKHYFETLGCNCNFLKLTSINVLKKEDKSLLKNSNIIYLGGGSTDLFMENIRRTRFDVLLKYLVRREKKIVMGMSAGAHVLCDYYKSSSDFLIKKGMGVLNFSCNVHFKNSREDVVELKELRTFSKQVFAISERSALKIKGNELIPLGKRVFKLSNYGLIKLHET